MDLDALITRFRSLSGDSVSPYLWSSTDITAWLNEAVEEACIRKKLLFDKSTEAICQVAITAGTGVFDLDSSIIEVRHAYLVDSSDKVIPLAIYDREKVDRLDSDWRETTDEPDGVVFDDTAGELNYLPEADYTMYLEVYRIPTATEQMSEGTDSPVISSIHHVRLVDWALHVAYLHRDLDKKDQPNSDKALKRFELYFGLRPAANTAKRARANTPHRNKCVWRI